MSAASDTPRPAQATLDEPIHSRLPRAPEPPTMEPSISPTPSETLGQLPEPSRMTKSGSRSPTYPYSPRYSHHGQYPPTPPNQTTPPTTNAYPSYYQHHQQLPHVSNYQAPRPIHIPREYPDRRPDIQYGGQYPPTAPSSAHMQSQNSRHSFPLRYQGGSELVRRISSQGYGSHAPSEMGPSRHDMYPFEDTIDDGPIYGGRHSPPLSGFQGDPHSNLDGIIQRAQGAVSSLTLSIPSLQQLCDRYNAVNDELQRYYQIASDQDKDIEELQAKERQLEALKENMEQNLQMNTAEMNRLKLKIADLEVEVKRLNASIETKDRERIEFEVKFNQEREALRQEFQKWKEETLTAHDNEKTSMVDGHDAEKRIMEETFASEKQSLEDSHGAKTMDLEASHADKVKELEEGHESKLRELERLHEAKVKDLEDIHVARVMAIEEAFEVERKYMEDGFVEEKKGMEDVFAEERKCMEDVFATEKQKMEEEFTSEKLHMEEEFTSEKLQMTEDFSSQKLSIEEGFASQKKAIEDDFANQKIELQETFEIEKVEMISTFETAKMEWGEEKDKIISDFKDEKTRLDEIIRNLEDDKRALEDVKMALEADKAGLEGEKATLLDEKSTLIDERTILLDEKSTLLVEKTTLIDENSSLLVEKTTLIDEKTILLDEKSTLLGEKTTLIDENSTLLVEKTTLIDERSILLDEKSTLLGEKAALEDVKTGLEGTVATLEDKTATLQGDKEALISEKERQQNEWENEKARLQEMIEQLESVKSHLLNDNNKLVETLKDVAEEEEGSEIRSRGDCFYIDAFQKLAKDIIDISNEFSNLPISPPGVSNLSALIYEFHTLRDVSYIQKILAELPSGLPSMLGNSDASRLIRMAYVQHIISKYLCHRIFQPFLFSLGKRYDKADTFFQSMSNQLREKSTRKEAVWRHYTLLAGYTASNAKKNAGVAAASVIEEIAGYVKPFADQKNMDIITSGITRIVKFAVETWRYARMEREIISASMTTDDTERSSWECHAYERQSPYFENIIFTSQLKTVAGGHVMVLPLLPVFSREGTLPTLHRPLAVLDGGLVFSRGTALYNDCLPVLHRRYELDLLQLPMSITAKERVAQLDVDREIEEVKEEAAAAEAAVTEVVPILEEELIQEQEPSQMEGEAEKAIEEALRNADIAAALAKATELEVLKEVEVEVEETVLETVEAEPEQSLEVDTINHVPVFEPATVEVAIEVEAEVAHIPEQETSVEVAVEAPQVEELAGGYLEVTVEADNVEAEVEKAEVVEMLEVVELLVSDEVEVVEAEVEIMVELAAEETNEELIVEESVVGGVEIEQEPELEILEQEYLAAPMAPILTEDCKQTGEEPAYIFLAPQENTEEPAELLVEEPLPILETIQEVAPELELVVAPEPTEAESEPPVITVEEVESEIIVPKPAKTRKSKLPKKLGAKKAKKSAL